MNRVYWVRHGENRANLTREFSYKHVDYSLTPKGFLQAEQTADYFSAVTIDAVFSSPLKRAGETAAIIAARLGLPVTVVEELREINVGTLEGALPSVENWKAHDRILEAWCRGERDLAFPGGESCNQLIARVQAGLRRILAGRQDQTLLIASHGGCLLMGLPDLGPEIDPARLWAKSLGNCAFSEILFEQKNGQLTGEVVRWGISSHLSGLAGQLVWPVPDEQELAAGLPRTMERITVDSGGSQ